MNSELNKLVQTLVPKLPAIILGLILGYILIKIALFFLKKALRLIKAPKSVIDILLSLSSIVLWIIFFSEFSRQIGLSGLAVTFSGVLIAAGLAIANGASSLVSDVITGLFLARDPDFSTGYKVKNGEIEGRIKKIDIRKVRIEDEKGIVHVLPNAKFDSNGWSVLDRGPKDE